MKYELCVDIKSSPERIFEHMRDPETLRHWHQELTTIVHLEGKVGEQGSKHMLKFKMKDQNVEMTQTLTRIDHPKVLHFTYRTNGVINHQENYFIPTAEGTRWTAKSRFKFSSLLMKFVGWAMPGEFVKQSRANMEHFKAYIESDALTAHEPH